MADHDSRQRFELQPAMAAALGRLGIDRLVLAIHQASFPASDDDLGHGSPYGRRGGEFIEWAASLGFTGIMLGPSGVTSRDNPSPYDGSALSRNPLYIAFGQLAGTPFAGLVDDDALGAALAAPAARGRVAYRAAWEAQRRLLERAADRLAGVPAAAAAVDAARARLAWLADEERYEALAAAAGHDDWSRWAADAPVDLAAGRRFALEQTILEHQHAALHARTRRLGLSLYGDLAIGLSHRDRWQRAGMLLDGYAMGAPPSRTNPEGQPWNYPVLDPAALAPGGAARRFLEVRFARLADEHDGVRIDHPHGWVCPWVYRCDAGDPAEAVRRGARLFESPDLSDHPALARFARVGPEQLDRHRPRHDDRWVRDLTPEQVDRYALIFDLMVAEIEAGGRGRGELVVEVLSTCPLPLEAVLRRHGLGRFRVTQKAAVADRLDVYRGDRAAPADWIMVGNHDTPPLRLVVDRWLGGDEGARRATYLADRLAATAEARAGLAATLARDGQALATAMLAELFLGPARNVQIFWPDLFGLREIYNRPGVVADDNWSLRVPADFEGALATARAAGDAPDLGAAVAMALHARGLDQDPDGRALAAQLRGD
jgi:4-alpha-glucanotransferase